MLGIVVNCEECDSPSMMINQLCSLKLEWKCEKCGYSRTFSIYALDDEMRTKKKNEK